MAKQKLQKVSSKGIEIDTFRSESDFLLYTTPNRKVKIEIFLKDENIWLTQEKIAGLFGVERSVVTKHLKNIFESGELQENSVCANFARTAGDGKIYRTKFYNLDAIQRQK